MNPNKVFITPFDNIAEDGSKLPSFVFDLCTEFTPVFSNKVTKFKVSSKSNKSSHVFTENDVITVTGYVSTIPFYRYNNLISYSDLSQRPQLAYDVVKKWVKDRTQLTLVNKFDVFTPCIITRAEPTETGSSLLISFTFERIETATYQRVTLVQNMTPSKKMDSEANTSNPDGSKKLNTKDDLTLTQKYVNQLEKFNKDNITDFSNKNKE